MTITALPDAPNRTDGHATFVTKADAFVAALPTFVTEANAIAVATNTNETNCAASEVAAAASESVALAAANFEGAWVAGTYTRPSAVTHSGDFWILEAVSSTGEPGVSGDWVKYLSAAQILSLLLTVDGTGSTLDADLLDGLQAVYFQQNVADRTSISVNNNGTGDRNAYIDLVSDDTNPTSARIIRAAGVNSDLTVANYGTGGIILTSTGDIELNSSGSLYKGASLVHHAGQDSGWINGTYQNGWSTWTGGAPAGYRKLPSGLVVLRGYVTGGSFGVTVFTLPTGYRPEYTLYRPITASVVALGGYSTMALSISSVTGNVVINYDKTGTSAGDYIYIDCSFMVA